MRREHAVVLIVAIAAIFFVAMLIMLGDWVGSITLALAAFFAARVLARKATENADD